MKRFNILNQDDQLKWYLPDDRTKYANPHFNQYVHKRDLKESILTGNTVPSITEAKKMDEFMSHLLKRNNQTSECTLDITFEKNRRKILMSCDLYQTMAGLRKCYSTPDDEIDLTIEELINLVQ